MGNFGKLNGINLGSSLNKMTTEDKIVDIIVNCKSTNFLAMSCKNSILRDKQLCMQTICDAYDDNYAHVNNTFGEDLINLIKLYRI